MPGPIEIHVTTYGHLPPDIWSRVSPFLPHLHNLTVHWWIQPHALAWATKLLDIPAVTVYGETIVCVPGVLDANGIVRGRLWSWSLPEGLALWAHEMYHVWQYRDNPGRFAWSVSSGIVRSLLRGRIYDHTVIEVEQEAIAFERSVCTTLRNAPRP